ncbi:MAG: class I SAM-dependent methyltransferase [Candidatus Aminicenantales bacterium]
MDKERVGRFYDVVWTEYVPEYEPSEKHWRLFYSPEEVKGRSVLDAGCGTGIFSIIFARNGAGPVVGIDISEGSLDTAQNLKKRSGVSDVSFRKADMLNLPFSDRTFDVVWAWGTVHHTTDPFRAIEELIRVLKPSGSLLLAVYKRTRLTSVHDIIRKTLIRMPRKTWKPVARVMAFFLAPVIFFFKKREKSRKGETLEELIIDWYFVPIRHHYTPEEIKSFLQERGLVVEKFLPASGRFDSTSNFIFKARKVG